MKDEKLEDTDIKNTEIYPTMTKWFSFDVLKNAAKRVILSSIFGEYADRRLIQAALNLNCKPYTPIESKEEFWVDYVADLGDGFDSTYAIAYLLGQKEITVEEHSLPQGDLLIMGGDQVYPVANNADYHNKLLTPYQYAFPKTNNPTDNHPSLFLIPGNHDWYDGLSLFLSLFCKGENRSFGKSSWHTQQTRSYFAIELPNNWWIWGVDTQLGENIDIPQAQYFEDIAKEFQKKSLSNIKIILCVSSPTWLEINNFNKKVKFDKGVKYIVNKIIKQNIPDAKIYSLLTGDSHHYSRYKLSHSGTEFITAGGGGAFLHPTHSLPDSITNLEWGDDNEEELLLVRDDITNKESCYPSQEVSKNLAKGNKWFISENFSFSFILAALYGVAILLLSIPPLSNFVITTGYKNSLYLSPWLSIIYSPSFLIILFGMLFIGRAYALKDDEQSKKVNGSGIVHGLVHFILIFLLAVTFKYTSHYLYQSPLGLEVGSFVYIIALLMISLIGGIFGAVIWGFYLLIVSYYWGLQSNDAFSSMKLTSYKNFLRLHFKEDTLTIYPIGLKKVPTRNQWIKNKKFGQNQYEPRYVCSELKIELIENPIIISDKDIK